LASVAWSFHIPRCRWTSSLAANWIERKSVELLAIAPVRRATVCRQAVILSTSFTKHPRTRRC